MKALAIGRFDAYEKERIADAANSVGLALSHHDSPEAVLRGGESAPPACILVTAAELAGVTRGVRGSDTWFNVPVIALVTRAEDRAYRTAFANGADDVLIAADVAGMKRRFANLSSREVAARPPAERGVALVAASSDADRQFLGRVLRHAGFNVAFACEARELMRASTHHPTLVVATTSFPPLGGDAAVRTVRTATQQPDLPSIVLDAAGVSSGGVDVDRRGELLFFADEATRRAAEVDQRASRRLHYATLCGYKRPEDVRYTHGLTHDISREGLFVRTLDPPDPGTHLWLELRTPDGRPAHLRGEVVWQHHPAQSGSTAPSGFGFRIDGAGPPLDLEAFQGSYDGLLVAPVAH